MKPAKMCKISITGHKEHLQKTIDTLYRLKLLDIETYDGELETGDPFDEAEGFSETLVDIRSLLSTLPNTESEQGSFQLSRLEDDVETVSQKVEEFQDEIADLEDEKREVKTRLEFLRKLRGAHLTIEDLDGTRTLDTFVGEFDINELEEEASDELYEVYEGEGAAVVVYKENSTVEEALREIDAREIKVPEIRHEGHVEEVIEVLENRRADISSRLESLENEMQEFSDRWRPKLEEAEEFLTERVEKAEAPLNFATTDSAFIAEGWIPDKKFNELGEELHRATGGKVHIQEEEAETEPPTKHENSRAVQPFESLTDLVSVPKHDEIDPSIILLLTFPLMFGFMIGDLGYGITSLAVFYAGYRMFPEAGDIFKSLMWASVATMFFGILFGDAFGFVLYGKHSVLAHEFGLHMFGEIKYKMIELGPLVFPFHRATHLGNVFNIAVIIGFIHVNLGYLVGFYNEFVNHGLKEAFLEKISWLLLEIGALGWYAFGSQVGAPILAISLVMLYVGEGVEGLVEIPSLLSNILSYFRIFGVSVAAVSLAKVVNAMASPLFQSGSVLGLALGITVLMVGHFFNTFIKIMEGFLQGIRLHYVEMFTKFYDGGGRKYVPFGAER